MTQITDQAITLEEVANRLGTSKRSVYRLIADNHLPKPFKERGKARILESELRSYFERIRNRLS